MRYPSMGSNLKNAVSIPALSGGVNLNDALNLVDDNQMTDCKNVWYKDGMLQTRPGLKRIKNFEYDEAIVGDLEIYPTATEGFLNGKKHKAIIKKKKTFGLSEDTYEYELVVFWEEGIKFSIELGERSGKYTPLLYFGKPYIEDEQQALAGIGLFILESTETEEGITTSFLSEVSIIQEGINEGEYVVALLFDRDYYSPCILINGKGESYSELPSDITTKYAPASFFEGHSLYHGAPEKYCFVTDGVSTIFIIPNNFLKGARVVVTYTSPDTNRVYATTFFQREDPNPVSQEISGTTFIVTRSDFNVFEIKAENGGMALPSSLGKIANNLVFEVFYDALDDLDNSKLADMKSAVWFGGSASGISGGTRLFLAGSEKEKNLLLWSDLNNPTYFSENNYAYVGSSSQRITALAKQDDMLVIFKENEIFYTTYVEGATYTADDVISGRVTDVTTLSAVFPITQIHSEIGCDLPNTIQLCGNRLVWACKDGNVYTLKSADQYSTANVAKISALVDKRLKEVIKTEGNLEANYSAVYKGHYLLMFGNSVFAMDFDQYYFNSLPAYSDTKKAQKKLIWYYWEMPQMESSIFKNFFSVNEQCYLFNVSTYLPASGGIEYANYTMFKLTEEALQDDCLKQTSPINSGDHISLEVVPVPIETVIQTKMFDFGAMERFKSIEQLYVEFGKANGEINLQYITERGRINDTLVKLNYEELEDATKFIKTKRFLPSIKRALKFGLRITAKGKVALGGILIKFKYMGVTR